MQAVPDCDPIIGNAVAVILKAEGAKAGHYPRCKHRRKGMPTQATATMAQDFDVVGQHLGGIVSRGMAKGFNRDLLTARQRA